MGSDAWVLIGTLLIAAGMLTMAKLARQPRTRPRLFTVRHADGRVRQFFDDGTITILDAFDRDAGR